VNDYYVLAPTNAHMILVYIALIWLLHVSAGYHPQAAHNQAA